jgi:hypothetical protein
MKTTETIELTRVFHQKEGGRVCDFLTNLPIDEVIKLNPFLQEKDRRILRSTQESITINDIPNCNEYFENGILMVDRLDKAPSKYADERAWNELYQKTTQNPIPKGGIFQ